MLVPKIFRSRALAFTSLALGALMLGACGGGNSASDEQSMRRTLEEFTDAVNARQFDKLLVLLDPRCLLLDEVSEMTEQWETLGDFVGDPDYRLEITSFDVKSQSGDSADIDMTAVMHTRRGTLPFGTPTDQVIDLMVRVDGKWRISDPECRDA